MSSNRLILGVEWSVKIQKNGGSHRLFQLDTFIFLFNFRRRGYTGFALCVRPSFRLYVTNIFVALFHASQPLQTWYGASAKGPARHLPNSGPPVIYYLFHDLVYFQTLHGQVQNFRRTFLSNHASQSLQTRYGASATGPTRRIPNQVLQLSTSCFTTWYTYRHNMVKCQIFVVLFSATMHHSHFKLGMMLRLGILHVAYRIRSSSYPLPVLRLSIFTDITWSSAKF